MIVRSKMTVLLVGLFAPIFVLGLCWTNLLSAQTTESIKKPQREIYVPFESLDVLLEGNSNRVLLTQDEYAELLQSAQTREIERAPLDSAIISAEYQGRIESGVAKITGRLVVEPLNDGLIEILLPLSGVAISSARYEESDSNDSSPKIWRNKSGKITLLTSGKRRQTLVLEMQVPLETTAARQRLALQIPAPAATTFVFAVPGNVEIKTGAAVVKRTYNENDNTTTFDLLASREPMNLLMSLNNRQLTDDQVIVSRSVLIHKLTPHRQEMHVTCSLDVIHGAMEEIELRVPAGYNVSQVSTELLNQWEIKEGGVEGDDAQRLLVKLRQPTRKPVVLSITAVRDQGATGQWVADEISPLNIAGHVSVVGVLADVNLKSEDLKATGVVPIDHKFLLAAIPSSVQENATDDRVSVVAAFYAPQAEYSISTNFSVPPPELVVKSSSRLWIDKQRLRVEGGLSLISRYDSRFGFKLSLPAGWRLNDLTDTSGNEIRFDRLDAKENKDGKERAEFLVHLPKRIPSDAATRMFFDASFTPDGWLESWDTKSVAFPDVVVVGETEHSGAIAIATSEDWLIKPTAADALELLDDVDKEKYQFDREQALLAYQFKDSDFDLKLDLQRLTPTVSGRSYNAFDVSPNQMRVHSELVFDIKQAATETLSFELPLDSPKSISIAANKLRLKDYSSEETESARVWTVQLAQPQKGKVTLLVDYQFSVDESQLESLSLTAIKLRDVEFQSSICIVEGSPELDVEIQSDARPDRCW